MSSRGVLALVAAVSVLAAGFGWVLGQRIKSPGEIAAETAPPEPSLITVPVEFKELSSRVVVRGTLISSEETPIVISGASEGTPYVTRMPKSAGDELNEGEVAIEITGRPVIVLQGRLPVYRSMGPSMEGPDVEQLEEALVRLGFSPGDVDDTYTSSTAAAVENLYRSLGYKADGPSPDEEAALKSARDQVTQAEQAVKIAGGSSSPGGVPESVKLREDQSVATAERNLADANAAKEPRLAAAKQQVETATADLNEAQKSLERAESRFAAAEGGTHPDTGQSPTPDEIGELEAEVAQAQTTVKKLTITLEEAKGTLEAEALQLDRAIMDAGTELAIARATRKETLASYASPQVGGGEAGISLADAKKQLADAQNDLIDLQSSIGVEFPAFELVFVPTLPRKVQSVSVELGSPADASVMSVTGTSTIIESAVSTADRKLLVNGLEALVEDDELGLSADAAITFIDDDPGRGALPDDRYAMELTPSEDLPEEAYNQSLRVTIPISSTGGEVLAVPLAAVSAGADGASRVEVQNFDGSTELVDVTTGLAADGFVEIRSTGGALEAGDRVVVGRDLKLLGSDEGSDSGSADAGDDGDGEASGG